MNATQLPPAAPKPALFIPAHVTERALSKRTGDDPNGCLISTYSVASHGYAQIGWNWEGERIVTLVHRVIWASEHGPIPAGMTVDHICKTRKCANIKHLRLLSNFENARRTSGRDWPLGECVNGHSNDHLEVFYDGRKHCGICARDWQRKYNASALGQASRARATRTPRVSTPRVRRPYEPKPPRAPKTHCRNGHEWIAENFYTRPSGRNECWPCKQSTAKVWHKEDRNAA